MTSGRSEDTRSTPLELDAQALARLRQLDPTGQQGLLRRVLVTYLGSLARLGAQISQGLDAGDCAGVRLGAHTLKSSSASVGALWLSKVCAAVEQAARDEQLGELPAKVAELLHEIGRVYEAIRLLIAD